MLMTASVARLPRPLVRAWAAFGCSLALMAVAAPPVWGQSSRADSSSDTLEPWQTYQLNEPAVTKFLQALGNMIRALRQHPDSDASRDLSEGSGGGPNEDPYKILAVHYDRHPQVKRAISTAGLTTYEYLIIATAFGQATFAQEAVHRRAVGDRPPAAGIAEKTLLANVAYLDAHPAEVKQFWRLQDEYMDVVQPAQPAQPR
jgi:hypothetical protein